MKKFHWLPFDPNLDMIDDHKSEKHTQYAFLMFPKIATRIVVPVFRGDHSIPQLPMLNLKHIEYDCDHGNCEACYLQYELDLKSQLES